MKNLYEIEDVVFDAGDKVSAFLYDQWGWHMRVILMWTYTLFPAPLVDMLIAGDRINEFGEWFHVGLVTILGLISLFLFHRASISAANTYMAVLRRGVFMLFLRMAAVAFTVAFLIGAIFWPSPGTIADAVHEVHYLICLYWVLTQVPDRPRRKRRLLPRLKLFEDPLPQGAS